MFDYEYRDYAGIEKGQYERYQHGGRAWAWLVWVLTAAVVVMLFAARVA